jgi:glutamate-1-semialdehyde 2,1-aminomutase
MVTEARRMRIDEEVYERMAGSAALYERAKQRVPSGVTHDSRYTEPFPLYVTRAQGSRKWDVDGNEFIDYFGGHGALILGHCYPAVTAAVVEQAQKGSHYGACHELEVEWAELVCQIVPCAEEVKFTSSGTEATMLAMRMARAHTNRDRIVKLNGNFHGWHDYATVGMASPYDVPISRGVPQAVQDTVTSIPQLDVDALKTELNKGDVAAIILLCNGLNTEYLKTVVDVAHANGTLVIFDEVVTGFRYAPGGGQEYFGVTPDMCTLAKILAGGYPGGAIAGRRDLFDVFEFRDDPQWLRFGRIAHPGTFNANPLSAAAGIACLNVVKDPAIQKRATATAEAIVAGANEAIARHGVQGQASSWSSQVSFDLKSELPVRKLQPQFKAAMNLGGVDPMGLRMIVSAVHDQRDIDQTLAAFDNALTRLKADGLI